VLGAATVRPMIERLLPGANIVQRPGFRPSFIRGQEDHPVAATDRHRRVLGRRGLCHCRTDPPPARRRGRGDGRAVAAHTQRPGRTLSIRRRRLSHRHRRYRHGAQPRCRPCGLRFRQQIRRLSVSQAQSAEMAQIAGRAGRAQRDGTSATTGRCPPFDNDLCISSKVMRSSRSECCNGATLIWNFQPSVRCRLRLR